MTEPASDDALEAALLGAECRLTRDEVAAAVGVPELQARALWNALGFPVVAPDVAAFTERDVDALRVALELGAAIASARTSCSCWPGRSVRASRAARRRWQRSPGIWPPI